MLKGLSIWALQDNESRSAEELFDEAREHGFEGIEMAIGEAGLLTPESTEDDCRALVETAESAGLEVTSLASGLGWQYPLTAGDESVRERGVELVQQSLRAASWLGVEALLVVPGTLAPLDEETGEHVPYDVAMERMRTGITRCIPTAVEVGVTLGIENVWNRVLLSPIEMRDFIDSFDCARVGSYLDVGNMILFGYAEDWIRILRQRICAVHFKDFERSVGTLEGFCPLLEGDVNYPAVMEGLRDVGYDGPTVAEFFGLDSEELDRLSESMDEILAM